ncbi:MAG: proprotein convertase P-domain-containing protein, partial [Alcanivoracaceae bacterium]|nr:proprotein convertase P-domain-containing protein [Alcanivoracaceae bacterium]
MQRKKLPIAQLKIIIITCLLAGNVSLVQAVPFNYTPISIVPASGAIADNGCDGNGVTVTFNVVDDFIVNDIDIGVNITHTYRGDLRMTLTSPNSSLQIYQGDGADGSDNFNVLMNSDSATAVAVGDHPITPDYVNNNQPLPATSLNSFDGENALGNWTFFVCDRFGVDTGSLTNAELRFDGTLNAATNQIGGTVYKELDNDGNNDANEIGVQNVTVTAYDAVGSIAGMATTDANGDYIIAGLTDTQQYRLEFTNVTNSYQPALEGNSSSTSVAFVTSPASNIDYGVGAPAQYCQADPD